MKFWTTVVIKPGRLPHSQSIYAHPQVSFNCLQAGLFYVLHQVWLVQGQGKGLEAFPQFIFHLMLDGDKVLIQFEPQARGAILEFRDFVFDNFDKLDQNQDGFLSREELLTALYQPERSMREVSFLNFLLVRIREIADCYQEDWANRPDAISKMDLQEYFGNLLSVIPTEE